MKRFLLTARGRSALLIAAALCGIGYSTTPARAAILEEINETRTPGFYYWAHPVGKLGWYWTPSIDMNLDSIQTQLNTRGFNINNNFILTTALYTDRPAVGGTLIDSFAWSGAGYGGGWTGGSFASPLSLDAGTTYFIGFSGWEQVLTGSGGGGVNWLEPNDYPPGSTFDNLFPAYMGNNWDTQANPGPNPANIDMPILRFIGTERLPPTGGAVPEPGSLLLLGTGLPLLIAARKQIVNRRRPV